MKIILPGETANEDIALVDAWKFRNETPVFKLIWHTIPSMPVVYTCASCSEKEMAVTPLA